MALSSLLVLPYATLLPVLAKVTFKGNASTYGYLNSFTGIGAIVGAVSLASLRGSINLRKVLLVATIVFGVGLILFSRTHSLLFGFFFSAIAGFGMMSQITLVNTLLQTTSSTEMRGRVISYFAMSFFGMQPVGALLVGRISHSFGASVTILSQGIIAIAIALAFLPYLWRDVPAGEAAPTREKA